MAIITLKGRYRCHELALSLVMAHTLIVGCVMFSEHSVNLMFNASSIVKVSPYEQFFGLKLDAKRDLRIGFGDYTVATHATLTNLWAQEYINSSLSAAREVPRAARGCPAFAQTKLLRGTNVSLYPCRTSLSKR